MAVSLGLVKLLLTSVSTVTLGSRSYSSHDHSSVSPDSESHGCRLKTLHRSHSGNCLGSVAVQNREPEDHCSSRSNGMINEIELIYT